MTTHSTRRRGRQTRLEIDRIADFIAPYVVGVIIARTDRGLDVDGRPFASYSASYRRELVRRGEQTRVDLHRTGSMISGLGERYRRHMGPDRLVIGIGPAAVDHRSAGVSQAALGAMHHRGEGRLPRRRWLGLSRAERRALALRLAKMRGKFSQR